MTQSCTFMRFFGKIRCTSADYFVVEATSEAVEEVAEDGGEDGTAVEQEGAKDPNQEERGVGVNKYTYFVTTDLFSPWKRLPDLSPA